jgi:hypothetical protein
VLVLMPAVRVIHGERLRDPKHEADVSVAATMGVAVHATSVTMRGGQRHPLDRNVDAG